MKLYDSLRAPNPRRVRWFLAEKGAEAEGQVEIIDVSIFGGEHRQPEYLA
jgi:glutathione S-transferase